MTSAPEQTRETHCTSLSASNVLCNELTCSSPQLPALLEAKVGFLWAVVSLQSSHNSKHKEQ